MSITERPRAGFYVDGFNLYHAIDDLGLPYLKWLSLRRLAEISVKRHRADVAEIVFCTAYFKGDFDKLKRHETYVAALEAEGVRVLFGHETKEPAECNTCGRVWYQPREKETDINVALALFDAARRDVFDIAYLITADTDQAATLRFMRNHFPSKKLVVLTPPKRPKHSHLKDLSDENHALSLDDIDMAALPAMIQPEKGRLIVRPTSYAPPAGWVHPDDRPK